jgi:protein tyrosine phosphatase (PTP) superfamily phosphohydrolase (DUF442 family)
MNREDIIRMAREAGFRDTTTPVVALGVSWEQVQRFAALVAAAEREACAEACEEVESRAEELWDKFAYPEDQGMASGARQCATAIRARGNT